jgi:hypothetical protein
MAFIDDGSARKIQLLRCIVAGETRLRRGNRMNLKNKHSIY